MSKQVFKVSVQLDIEFELYGFFKFKPLRKVTSVEKAWMECNALYIYANNKYEAIRKYKKIYPKALQHIYDDTIYDSSLNYDNLVFQMKMKEADIKSTVSKIICLNETEFFININDLKNNMNAVDYKAWLCDSNN